MSKGCFHKWGSSGILGSYYWVMGRWSVRYTSWLVQDEEISGPKAKAFNSLVHLHYNLQLVMRLSNDWKHNIINISTWAHQFSSLGWVGDHIPCGREWMAWVWVQPTAVSCGSSPVKVAWASGVSWCLLRASFKGFQVIPSRKETPR